VSVTEVIGIGLQGECAVTALGAGSNSHPSRPCVAILRVSTRHLWANGSCIDVLYGYTVSRRSAVRTSQPLTLLKDYLR
jgi:hypothetical protein